MCILDIIEYKPDHFGVTLICIDEFEVEYGPYIAMGMRVGDRFAWLPDEEYKYHPGKPGYVKCEYGRKKRTTLSPELVGMKTCTKQDTMAKFDAYMDPSVAALAETPGRITRNKHYDSIGTTSEGTK